MLPAPAEPRPPVAVAARASSARRRRAREGRQRQCCDQTLRHVSSSFGSVRDSGRSQRSRSAQEQQAARSIRLETSAIIPPWTWSSASSARSRCVRRVDEAARRAEAAGAARGTAPAARRGGPDRAPDRGGVGAARAARTAGPKPPGLRLASCARRSATRGGSGARRAATDSTWRPDELDAARFERLVEEGRRLLGSRRRRGGTRAPGRGTRALARASRWPTSPTRRSRRSRSHGSRSCVSWR